MDISTLTPEIIECMDADTMRCTLKAEYTKIQMQKAEQAEQARLEEERNEQGRQVVNDFFARKFANLKR